MLITAAATAVTSVAAEAGRCWASNLRALATTQPEIVSRVQPLVVEGEWVAARDGSTTLRTHDGQWLGGCSLPYRAAVVMLKSLEPRGTVACFLAPIHAAEIRAALEKLSAQHAVVVLQPELRSLRIILGCEDFSADIAAGRVFFITGDTWADDFRQLFNDRPGLPTPQQFIKLPTLADEIADPLINTTQPLLSAVLSARAAQIIALREQVRPTRSAIRKIAVIAGSRFQLWDDAGSVLAAALKSTGDVAVQQLDPDQPLASSPLATALFCHDCDALITADTARCDFPDVLRRDLPWATWVSKGRIPKAETAGPRDGLLVADPDWRKEAIAAGWPENRVFVATFPARDCAPSAPTKFAGWTVIAHTVPVSQPEKLNEFSSHKLLWESIAQQLYRDPFALTDDINAFLHKHCRAVKVDESTLDMRLFIESLLLPAYQQGVVRAMMKAKVPVRVLGRGWDEIEEFKPIAGDRIESADALNGAIASSTRLVHVWPTTHVHPMASYGLPVLKRTVSRIEAFVDQARKPAAAPPSKPADPISLQAVVSLLLNS